MARAKADPARRIVEATMAEAERVGWPRVRLFAVADAVGVGLDELKVHFRDMDAIADAWLARGEAAMLKARAAPRFARLAPAERLHRVITAFLDSLAAHRRVTGEIFRAKLYLGHPHHNIGLVLWVSRTVQWVREAAHLRNDVGGPAVGDRRRRVEEIGLTALFLATIVFWLNDDSPGQERTRAFLRTRLADADRLMGRLFPAG
jgi:AcrR family transcriptional regulator